MLQFEKLNINFNGDTKTEKWFKEFLALVPFMPALHSLIIEATQKGPINIDFVSRAELATGGSYHQHATTCNGVVVDLKRSIKLPKEEASPAKIIETLIFELCNANNPYLQFYSPQYVSAHNYNNRDDYARAVEYAEYAYTHLAAKRVDKAVFSELAIIDALKNKGIHFSDYELRNIKTDPFTSFNHWWHVSNTLIAGKNYCHADVYRRQFDQAMGKPQPVASAKPLLKPAALPPARHLPQAAQVQARPLPKAPVKVQARPLPKPLVQVAQPLAKQDLPRPLPVLPVPEQRPVLKPVVKKPQPAVMPAAQQRPVLKPVVKAPMPAQPKPAQQPARPQVQKELQQGHPMRARQHVCPHRKALEQPHHAKQLTFTFTIFVGKGAQPKQMVVHVEQNAEKQFFKRPCHKPN